MKLFIGLALFVLVSADPELDALENAANNVMSRLHAHIGGQGGDSFSSFLSSGEFVRDAALQLNKTRRDRIEEGLGTKGVTFVVVKRGKKEVKLTTSYGVGAGAIVNLRDTKRSALAVEEPSQQELDEITQPFYTNFVDVLDEGTEGDNSVVVRIGDEARKEFNLRDKSEDLRARARGGFRVGARTVVSRKG